MQKNNPFFMTEQVKNELLPPGTLDLLRLPAKRFLTSWRKTLMLERVIKHGISIFK